ncbi:Unconventional myosin-XVIIIb [Dirofilaria immitis]
MLHCLVIKKLFSCAIVPCSSTNDTARTPIQVNNSTFQRLGPKCNETIGTNELLQNAMAKIYLFVLATMNQQPQSEDQCDQDRGDVTADLSDREDIEL